MSWRISVVTRLALIGLAEMRSKEFFRSTMLDPSRLRRWMTAGAMSLVLLGPAGNAAAASPATGDPAGFVATVGQQVVQVSRASNH